MSFLHRRRTADRFADAPLDGPLLDVNGVKTFFKTERGLVHAVDGVSLTLERGKTLGIVGESGSGKSVLSRSIMGLLPSNVERHGSIKFEGQEIGGQHQGCATTGARRCRWCPGPDDVAESRHARREPDHRVLRFHLDVSKD
jgi:ABC-type dipeptide/oligopeptide/nickel transport system ATPase component